MKKKRETQLFSRYNHDGHKKVHPPTIGICINGGPTAVLRLAVLHLHWDLASPGHPQPVTEARSDAKAGTLLEVMAHIILPDCYYKLSVDFPVV